MITLPKFRINLKPLVKGPFKVDPKKVLKSVQREIVKRLREEIQAQAFSPQAKRALMQGMTTKIGPNGLTVTAKHPAFFPLLEGRKREQMSWLVKAKRPIPIILDDGTLIFRNATRRSMERGRWYHPGRQATTVIEKARKITREVIRTRLTKEMRKQLQLAMKRVG